MRRSRVGRPTTPLSSEMRGSSTERARGRATRGRCSTASATMPNAVERRGSTRPGALSIGSRGTGKHVRLVRPALSLAQSATARRSHAASRARRVSWPGWSTRSRACGRLQHPQRRATRLHPPASSLRSPFSKLDGEIDSALRCRRASASSAPGRPWARSTRRSAQRAESSGFAMRLRVERVRARRGGRRSTRLSPGRSGRLRTRATVRRRRLWPAGPCRSSRNRNPIGSRSPRRHRPLLRGRRTRWPEMFTPRMQRRRACRS